MHVLEREIVIIMSDCLKQLFFERKESSEWEYQTRITELAQTRGRDRVRLRHVMA